MISDLIYPTIAAVIAALVGGIVGAIATSVMSLWIGKKSRAAATTEKESRLAHAYVVELDGYSNIEKLYNKSIADAENDSQRHFKYPNTALDSTRDYILNLQKIAPSHEQQALLPKATVHLCQRYEKQWKLVKYHYEILKGLDPKETFYGEKRPKCAEKLVCQVQLFFEYARELKADLMKYEA